MTHQESLKCLCRLCGGPVTKVNYVQKFSKDIKLALHIDVTTDSDLIHPPYMCTSCRLKLNRWRTKKNRTKIADPISLEVPSWIPHDNKCSICPSKTSTPISIVDGAKEAADQLGLISWTCNGSFVVSKFTRGGRFAERNLVINSDNTWEGAVLGKNVSCVQMCPNIPDKLRNAADACALVMALFGRPICNGNIGFDNIVDNRTTLTGKDGEVVAEIIDVPNLSSNSVTSVCKSIRHIKCQLFATSSSGVCQVCASYRVNLNSMKSRAKCSDTSNIHVNASSSTRNDFLTPEQLKDKMNDMQRERRNLINKNKSLQAQIRDLHERDATTLDEEQSQFIQEAFVNAEQVINDTSDEMAAFKLMFEQQRKAMDAKDSRQIRWHPSIIRFCIALFNKSSAAYDMLRKSPFIKLPHQSTLRQYMNFTNPQTGVNPDVLEFVANDWSFDELPDYKRNVTLIFDEVKIKAGLAYSKSSGKIIGYTDLGPVTNELEHFNAQLKSELDNESDPNIATQMLVLMARGIFSPMRIPISYFPTKNASCDQLYLCIWPTVKALTLAGLYVRAFVADGASWNKKFFIHHVHLDSRRPGETIYYTKHRYMRNGRLYFICDTPHLIKTTRNNFENSGWNLKSRNLHYKHQDIKWTHLLDLWKWDRGEDNTSPGYRLMKKIGEAHLYLTPSLRMKVSLAAQVLSTTVANCFALQGRYDTKSTELFVRMFDKFFDCLNVKTPYQWIRSNKEVLKPYTDENDERFKWLLQEFLPFLNDWQQEAMATPGLTAAERKKLCLSDQTLEGLRITVMSFVELSKDLLRLPGVQYLCSDKLNQDPLEEFFSLVRGAGGANSNPSAMEFGNIHLNLLVAGSNSVSSTRGNCHNQKRKIQLDETPLPKKKKKKTKKLF